MLFTLVYPLSNDIHFSFLLQYSNLFVWLNSYYVESQLNTCTCVLGKALS